jgi:hypothetical protein
MTSAQPGDEQGSSAASSVWSIRTPSSRRSLLFCAAGALLGLAMAGVSLFTAKGTRTSSVPAEDIALVNGVPVLMSDYVAQLRALYDVSLAQASRDQKTKVLEDMIREELYVQRGIELGMQTDSTEVRSALVGAVESQATIEAGMVPPGEPELRALYESRKDAYADEGTMTLTDYVSNEKPPPGSMQLLRAGGGGEVVAQRLGLVSSGAVDGGQEFYFAARIHLGERLFEVARTMQPGQVSDPIEAAGKWHVLVMHQNTQPAPAPFNEVIDRLRNDYVAMEAKRLQARTERFLRQRAEVAVQRGFE